MHSTWIYEETNPSAIWPGDLCMSIPVTQPILPPFSTIQSRKYMSFSDVLNIP